MNSVMFSCCPPNVYFFRVHYRRFLCPTLYGVNVLERVGMGAGIYHSVLLGTGQPRNSIPDRGRTFIYISSPLRLDRFWVPSTLLSSGYLGSSVTLMAERPGREPDHLLPSCAEVENTWNMSPLPQTSLWHSI